MGAKCLFTINGDEKSSSQASRELQRRVEAHTGRRVGQWSASSIKYHSRGNVRQPAIYVFKTSEESDSCFVATGTTVIEADDGFTALMEKIQWTSLKAPKSVRGLEYDLADFRLRVGMYHINNNSAVAIVEIEYRPCSVVKDCNKLITELMEKIASPLVAQPDSGQDSQANAAADMSFGFTPVTEDFDKYADINSRSFTAKHSALLYLRLMGCLSDQ
mmetsp:Transcript_3719/g.11091  ORF Transcript_3719/g.11091 Transcript_3719/m.11091 type:complete len:217 (+) Transcript_3719:201-851(+)